MGLMVRTEILVNEAPLARPVLLVLQGQRGKMEPTVLFPVLVVPKVRPVQWLRSCPVQPASPHRRLSLMPQVDR